MLSSVRSRAQEAGLLVICCPTYNFAVPADSSRRDLQGATGKGLGAVTLVAKKASFAADSTVIVFLAAHAPTEAIWGGDSEPLHDRLEHDRCRQCRAC